MRIVRRLTTLAALFALAAVVSPAASALDIADGEPPPGAVGASYSYRFDLSPGSGSPGATWRIDSGMLPPGLALSSHDRYAILSGTPTTAGTFAFYVQVIDAPGPWVCCTEEPYSITITGASQQPSPPSPPPPPLLSVATLSLPPATLGVAYNAQLATTGGEASTWSVSSGRLPTGLTLSSRGQISGMPGAVESQGFSVSAASGSRAATRSLAIDVLPPLVVTAPEGKLIKLGRSFVVGFAGEGGLPPYRWSGVSLPEGVAVNPDTGQVGGRPRSAGRLEVTLALTDALGTSRNASVAIDVAEKLVLDTSALPVARVGVPYETRLTATGGLAPLLWRHTVGGLPRGLRFDATTATIRGTVKAQPGRGGRARPRASRVVKLWFVVTDAAGQRRAHTFRLSISAGRYPIAEASTDSS